MTSSKNALIVIDVQNAFMNDHTKHIPKKIIRTLQTKKFNYVLFSAFLNKKNSIFSTFLNFKECSHKPDTEYVFEFLKFITRENFFPRTAYSVLKSKKLTSFLKKKNITTLYLCGLDTDACIMASALEAIDLGFKTFVIESLCSSSGGKKFHEVGIFILKRNGQIQKD